MMLRAIIALALGSAACDAQSEWKVVLQGDSNMHDIRIDRAYSHSLAFFRQVHCGDCTPAEAVRRQAQTKIEITPIAKVFNWSLYYVSSACPCGYEPAMERSASWIVKDGVDTYYEIVSWGSIDGGLTGATQVNIDERHILLWGYIDEGGNRHSVDMFGFLFDQRGALTIDFQPLKYAAHKIAEAPPLVGNSTLLIWNAVIEKRGKHFVFRVPVRDSDTYDAVDVEFNVAKGKIIVEKSVAVLMPR